jgi:hypothetical protein
MKVVYHGPITLSIILESLFTATFVNLFKLTLSNQMWQNCLMCVASFYLGRSGIIIPKFRLNSGSLHKIL